MPLRIACGLWWFLAITLAGLWIGGLVVRLAHFISTDRFCLILSTEGGAARIHYDGGPDVLGLKTSYKSDFAGAKIDVAAGRWDRIDARLPFWMPGLVLLLLGLGLRMLPGRRSRRRLRLGQCLHCGYDLRGNTTGRCSECGKAVKSDLQTPRDSTNRHSTNRAQPGE